MVKIISHQEPITQEQWDKKIKNTANRVKHSLDTLEKACEAVKKSTLVFGPVRQNNQQKTR